jgi:hypothetical protein
MLYWTYSIECFGYFFHLKPELFVRGPVVLMKADESIMSRIF